MCSILFAFKGEKEREVWCMGVWEKDLGGVWGRKKNMINTHSMKVYFRSRNKITNNNEKKVRFLILAQFLLSLPHIIFLIEKNTVLCQGQGFSALHPVSQLHPLLTLNLSFFSTLYYLQPSPPNPQVINSRTPQGKPRPGSQRTYIYYVLCMKTCHQTLL